MKKSQLKALKLAYSRIEPFAGEFSALFYERCFFLAPRLKEMFERDLATQHEKFMAIIVEIVRRPALSFPVMELEKADAFIPGAYCEVRFGKASGAERNDFEVKREALLWALDNHPEIRLTPDEREAWGEAFDSLGNATGVECLRWPEEDDPEHSKESRSGSPEAAATLLKMADRCNQFSPEEARAADSLRDALESCK